MDQMQSHDCEDDEIYRWWLLVLLLTPASDGEVRISYTGLIRSQLLKDHTAVVTATCNVNWKGNQMEPAKTEYEFLLGFYLHLSVFDPFTSTFQFLTATERQEIMLTISVLQRKLQEVMPKVQDREAITR